MAFEMIEKYRIYICESTDVKKINDIEVGSYCFEIDTGYRYMFNGLLWVYFPESVQISNGIDNVGIKDSALNVNQFTDFNTVLGVGLNPKVTGPGGFTSHGISTTVENFLTPLRDDFNLSNIYYPSSAQTLWLASTSAEDNPNGLGASVIGVPGLDENFNEIFDVVILDGINPVETNLQFIRANALFILAFGTNNVIVNDERFSEGNIFLAGTNDFTLGIPDNPILAIDGENANDFLRDTANRCALYTVPDDRIMLVKDYTMNTELAKAAKISIHVRFFGEDFFRMVSPQTLQEGVNELSFDTVFGIPPRTDLQMRTKNNTGTSDSFVAVNFTGALYDIS